MTEGQEVLLEAVILLSDGTRKTVTGDTDWKVIGSIGQMEKPGVFMPALDPSVAENGTAPGAIVATWKDPITGTVLINKTPIFNVNAKVEPLVNPEG